MVNPPAVTIHDTYESSTTSEHGKKYDSTEVEEEDTNAHKSPVGTGKEGGLDADENGTAVARAIW